MKKNKKRILNIFSALFGIVAIFSFSLFSIFSTSENKANSVKAESRIIYSESSSPINFDLQLYIGSNPLPTGKASFEWIIGLKYYIDSDSNTYNLDVTHNVKVNLTSINNNTFIGTNTFSNIFSPQNNLKFGFRVHSLEINRNSAGSSLVINYDLLNDDSLYRNVTFTITSSSWSIGGNMQILYNDSIFDLNDYSGFTVDSGYLINNSVSIDVNQGSPYYACIYLYSVEYIPQGYDVGYSVGYTNGFQQGYNQGQNQGFFDGYNAGVSNGYSNGYSQGKEDAELIAQQQIESAYQNGYSDGYGEGHTQDSTVASIFSGILTVGMLPVNFFLQIFNFKILGINLSAFISAIFTVALTIIVIKTVTGKGGGGNDK